MTIPTLPGITPKTITSKRLTTRVLFSGQDDGAPVLFLHGNSSSATWWEETMLDLPAGFRGIAPDLRGFGDAEFDKKIDATRGAGDWADDAVALLDALGIAQAHLVGNSLGGMVVWRLLADAPDRLLSVTVVDPGSPYGFGGTRDEAGTPCYDDFAGSGGGLIGAPVVEAVKKGDRSLENPFGYRSGLRRLVFRPPFVPAREEELLSASLSIHVGERAFPGDKVMSPNWPYVAPGVWGAANALSPKYVSEAVERMIAAQPKRTILWVRGRDDLSVSDNAAADMATLGALGLVPGWPGAEVFPSQPMLKQTRAVLERYAAGGGSFREVVINEAGHAPFIEKPDEFNAAFHAHLAVAS
ncbi:MAG: alpha/beta hydrolase [Caldilineales bacterium]